MNESEIVAKFVADINALNGSALAETDIQTLLNKKLGRTPVYVVQYDDGTFRGNGYLAVKNLAHARVFKQMHWAKHFAARGKWKNGATIGATVKEVILNLV